VQAVAAEHLDDKTERDELIRDTTRILNRLTHVLGFDGIHSADEQAEHIIKKAEEIRAKQAQPC
jgi:hypothetical protein